MDIARLEHNGFIKRPALRASVVFADEDAQEHCVAREGHDLRPYAPSGETPNSQACSQKASTAQKASPMTMAPAVALHFGSG